MIDQAAFNELVASVKELADLKPRFAALELADATIERLTAEVLQLQRERSHDGIWTQDGRRVWSLRKVGPAF